MVRENNNNNNNNIINKIETDILGPNRIYLSGDDEHFHLSLWFQIGNMVGEKKNVNPQKVCPTPPGHWQYIIKPGASEIAFLFITLVPDRKHDRGEKKSYEKIWKKM